jgi:hypothetical protein
MVREGRSRTRIEDVHPSPDNKLLQNLSPWIVRGATPKGTVCIRVHRAYVGYIMRFAVINAGYKFQRDLFK